MRKAFTLMELLVVIAIIALLMAILLPVLKQARYVTRKVICGSNLRQISVGTLTYTADNKQYYPAASSSDMGLPGFGPVSFYRTSIWAEQFNQFLYTMSSHPLGGVSGVNGGNAGPYRTLVQRVMRDYWGAKGAPRSPVELCPLGPQNLSAAAIGYQFYFSMTTKSPASDDWVMKKVDEDIDYFNYSTKILFSDRFLFRGNTTYTTFANHTEMGNLWGDDNWSLNVGYTIETASANYARQDGSVKEYILHRLPGFGGTQYGWHRFFNRQMIPIEEMEQY